MDFDGDTPSGEIFGTIFFAPVLSYLQSFALFEGMISAADSSEQGNLNYRHHVYILQNLQSYFVSHSERKNAFLYGSDNRKKPFKHSSTTII